MQGNFYEFQDSLYYTGRFCLKETKMVWENGKVLVGSKATEFGFRIPT